MKEIQIYSSDEEVDFHAHKNLLENINLLGDVQHIQEPIRTETTSIQDEFHLTNSTSTSEIGTRKKPLITLNDITKALKSSNKHLPVVKEIKKVNVSKKVLHKPLEKPVSDRIQRTIGYEKVKMKLSRWDGIVAKNRSNDHQVFPLDCETIYINTGALKKPPTRSVKSDLMIEMEAIESKLNALKNNQNEMNNDIKDEEEKNRRIQEKLTRDELIARRKEITYLRTKESLKSAKARRQNKIKSKKYHKILKREKLKEQIKDFEILQKTDPEAALKKLETLEKSRIQERGTLRHKNTGTWAKNLKVRAKYDTDARKDLAEQLALSRELTSKQKMEDSEDSEEEPDDTNKNDISSYDPFNPWLKVGKGKSEKNEVDDFVSGYRKYWITRNENEKTLNDYKDSNNLEDEDKTSNEKPMINESENLHSNEDKTKDQELVKVDVKNSKKNIKAALKNSKKKGQKRKAVIEDGWLVEEINLEYNNDVETIKRKNIDEIFDEAENVIQTKVSKKLEKLSKKLKSDNVKKLKKHNNHKDELQQLKDLSFKEQRNRPEFDEELYETPSKEKSADIEKPKPQNVQKETLDIEKIDPTEYAKIKPKSLRINLQDCYDLNDECEVNLEDGENSRHITISEAFQDDDIIADFKEEREMDEKKNTEEIDLSLPGWGSWAGSGIKNNVNANAKKRLILKFPKEENRRDRNKQNVYINEECNKKIKEHLVSDLPFPFTSVKDFESSIRAPLGQSFIPESAFRLLTKPSVVTKRGHIITPMDESILVQSESEFKPIRKR